MAKKILIPLPNADFDPTESAVPWDILRAQHKITFATPDSKVAHADERMLLGTGLGPLKPLLAADKNARVAYQKMSESKEFQNPIKWSEINSENFDGVILPGGHAKGVRKCFLRLSRSQKGCPYHLRTSRSSSEREVPPQLSLPSA